MKTTNTTEELAIVPLCPCHGPCQPKLGPSSLHFSGEEMCLNLKECVVVHLNSSVCTLLSGKRLQLTGDAPEAFTLRLQGCFGPAGTRQVSHMSRPPSAGRVLGPYLRGGTGTLDG